MEQLNKVGADMAQKLKLVEEWIAYLETKEHYVSDATNPEFVADQERLRKAHTVRLALRRAQTTFRKSAMEQIVAVEYNRLTVKK